MTTIIKEAEPAKLFAAEIQSKPITPEERALLAIRLDQRQLKAFRLAAKGLDRKDIGRSLCLAPRSANNRVIQPAYKSLGTNGLQETLPYLIDAGVIDPQELTRGYDFSRFGSLSAGRRATLDNLSTPIRDQGNDRPANPKTVRKQLQYVYKQLGIKNRAQAIVLNRAYQHLLAQGYDAIGEKKEDKLKPYLGIFADKAQGRSYAQIANETGYAEKTLRNMVNRALKEAGARSPIEVAIDLVRKGMVDSSSICQGENLADFKVLPPTTLRVLEALTKPPYERNIRRKLAVELGISESNARNRLAEASSLFGNTTALRLAVLYYIYNEQNRADSETAA